MDQVRFVSVKDGGGGVSTTTTHDSIRLPGRRRVRPKDGDTTKFSDCTSLRTYHVIEWINHRSFHQFRSQTHVARELFKFLC